MVVYNNDLLDELKKELNFNVIEIENKENEIGKSGPKPRGLNRDSKIKGKCINENCDEDFFKTFRDLYEKKSPYCKKCTYKIANKKREETCEDLYGKKYVSQVDYVKQKIENTCIEKYGGKTPMASEEIKNKVKETTIKNHGVEHSSLIPGIIEKRMETRRNNLGIEHFKFSKESLEEYCNEFNIKLLDSNYLETTVNNYENIKREDIVYFKCNENECFNHGCKTFRQLIEVSGPFCENHTSQKMVEKCKESYLTNTGFDHPMHNPEHRDNIINKLKETHKDSEKSADIRKRTKETNIKNNGVEYPQQSTTIREKTENTNLKNYGVKHPAQNSEIAEKSSKNAYKKKEYIFPSGRIDEVQGTENLALDELIKNENIDENDIITRRKDVPEIWYKDDDGKDHRHYVDIFIKSQNRCIESKSIYTFEKNEEKVLKKKEAALKLGYLYEIWIYDNKDIRIKIL